MIRKSFPKLLKNNNITIWHIVCLTNKQRSLYEYCIGAMDGREATRRIRFNPETKDIPILAITALFRESELRGCIEAGCNDYIVKPFTFEKLQCKIQDFIPSAFNNDG